ncbi:kinesin-like protein KIN-14D isoform X1 [Oryza glaberrima]|uniref:kinesin-like protein KIN-14D isoform X1 n=1 Tax=Oryza glaberrima TaxID=4538 RepID=UPI00224C5CE2|nr:kinesin-like protein KIN-14D isoform X1 [Oryza glaberrima]
MSSSNNAAAAVASPDPSRRREDVVGWLLALFPDLPLPPPPEATDEDLRAALATGRLLCALLRRLCPGALLDDASTDNVGRFRAAVERMGVAKFSASDLERGQMTAVVNCILALKDRFGLRGGDDHRNPGFLTRCDSEGGRKRVESKLQRMLTSPIMSEPSSPVLGSDPYSPSQVFQLKQGGYADQLGGKYSDLLKSTSLDNAPTQSLLGVFNSILDESIERKNGQIPYRIACLLRKVILEIERRISTQAGHIRNQNNLIKAREEKYQSRIRVLEVLAGGMEKDKFGDKGQLAVEDMERLMKYQDDVVRLMKENEDLVRLLREKEDMVRLLKEKEDMVRLLKEKEGMINLKTVKAEETQRIEDEEYRIIKEKDDALDRLVKEKEEMIRLLKEKDDVVRLMKEKEDLLNLEKGEVEGTTKMTDDNKDRLIKEKNDVVLRLTEEKEEMVRLLKEKEDIIRLMKEKEDMVYLEKGEVEDRKQMTDDIKDKLIKEKDDIVFRLTKEKEEIIKLLEEKEDIIILMKEKEDMVNLGKGEDEDRKQMADDNKDRLIKEKDDIVVRLTKEKEEIIKEKDDIVVRLTKEKEEIIKLLEEKEDIISLMKQKEDMFMSIKEKENKAELKKIADEDAARSIKDKAEIMRLMKEKEDGDNTILKLKKESETLRSSYEESCRLLESKKEDVARLLTDKENNDSIISELKKELEETKRLHEAHSQQLETKAAQVSKELEQRIEEVKLMLDDSTKRRIELEELSETRIQFWKKKEVVINQFVSLQVQNVQDLKLSSVSVRHEILNCQNKWSEELAGLGKSLKVVTNTAEKYHGALAENRKLFNEIQELKGNIRVYCRIRPFRPGEDDKSSSVEYIGDNGELVLSNPTKQGKEGGKNFTFNKVFGPITTQDAVFKDIQPLIRSVLDGYNVCIFAYGQTGSGKTYTMMGPEKATEKEWGVNYRALNDLFNISHDRRDTITYELGVQMIEIYNEQIRDLLGSGGVQKKLGIQNTIQPNGLAVPDATMCPVTSTSHVIELMQTGHDNRAMSATALNERSSRSHSVVTIHVRGQDLKTGNTLRGALHLVDLAGSERVDRSAVTGDRLKEAQHINKSLAALGDVIFSLSQKNAHVPYRNSKLTQVLQTSLGGHAKTLMFVQVNPDVSSYTETLSTLKFAERVSGVELGVARSNKEGKEGKDVKELMDQLSLLKDTISKKDEEIDRLQVLNSSTRLKPTRQADSVLKHSSSSPGITSLGKGTSVGSGAASDLDNFSDTSDRQSEAGSMLSVDPEISGLADVDSDGRLSDASDGISMGAEADSSVSNVADQEQEKTSNTAAKERLTRAVNRVQKLTLPKAGQSSSLRPKPRDPAPARSSAATGVRKSSTSQATPPLARNNSTLKRGP